MNEHKHIHWITQNLWLIPFLPFLAAGITALLKQRFRSIAPAIVILAMATSFLLSLCACGVLLKAEAGHGVYREFINFDWIRYGSASIQLGFLLDPLSAMMLFVVTFVSLLVFIFSVGYMDHDENATRFFTFLSLFAGSMLLLVIANSLLLLFMAWELVGLSSFLLIGFWYHKPSAVAAMKKAFITTRIGDVGFLIGIICFYKATGTTLFYDDGQGSLEIAKNIIATGVALKIALLIFCGAVGKSGQFPLHVWLPDAMEGPTPVSALIHAATMVAAGVFLVGRMFPVFEINPIALEVVAYTGAFTALFAATIALAQWDIKRILAYSTVSQLGYMMMGLGVTGYVGGLFHLFTHAFFKALLFLGSGAIIYACHHEQDIRKMGGLKDKMPITWITYSIGLLALAGFPGFAGFFSKDEILLDCLHFAGGWTAIKANPFTFKIIPLLFGITGAFLTAFYMTRQYCYVFLGHPRSHGSEHAHEVSSWMSLPLILLAIMALITGFVGFPGHNYFHHVVAPAAHAHDFDKYLAIGSSIIVIFALLLGYKIYSKATAYETDPLEDHSPSIFKVLNNKYYIDELYEKTFIAFTYGFAKVVKAIDQYLIGGLVILTKVSVFILSWINQQIDEFGINKGFDKGCSTVRQSSSFNQWIQNGFSQHYLKITSAGIVIIFLLAIILGR